MSADTGAAAPFATVPDALQPALVRRGFTALTAVQQAILAADDGVRDLRIRSQTGSGKTVALGIALARSFAGDALAQERRGPLALVVAPTRELAAQVKEELSWLFADVPGARCGVVTGGTSVDRERTLLQRRPAMLVGTPGRLLDHVGSGALDLGSVRQLVLDEADQMLDLGFKDELDGILAALPKERRTHLVSATVAPNVQALADRFQSSPILVAGTPAGAAHGDIEHIALKVGARDHYAALVNLLLLAGDERTLVFVRTREGTSALADKLAGDGFLALPIHGDLAQAQRTRTLQAFRRGAIHTLIATDVAARGLDITDVTSVVHFDPPIDAETYVHRSGRTGRAGQKGRSYLFVVKSRANFARRLFHEARVKERWEGCPGPAEVRAHRLAQAGERAAQTLAAAAPPGAAERALADQLLAGRDPAAVVALLLGQMATGPCEPSAVAVERDAPAAGGAAAAPAAPAPTVASPRPAATERPAAAAASAGPAARAATADAPAPAVAPAHTAKRPAAAAAVSQHAPSAPPDQPASAAPAAPAAAEPPPGRRLAPGQRGKAGAPPAWQRPAAPARGGDDRGGDTFGGFQRFRINWGSRDGADPRRVMAHVCRRGGVDSDAVGQIRVQVAFTTFEIAAPVAAAFERSARRPDRRDPHLVISRDRFGGR
ncbi:MAG: DEAD/DEAH box helicase [Planctomycetota bacterium]